MLNTLIFEDSIIIFWDRINLKENENYKLYRADIQDKEAIKKIFDENIFKVVEVKSLVSEDNWGYATGCFIDNNGTILTNKHVVQSSSSGERYEQIMVRTADSEEWVAAEVVKVSEEYDLAKIKCNLQKDCFSLSENVKNGETVYTIGNPDGFGLSFISGVVSINSRNVVYEGKTINNINGKSI